MSDHNFVCRTCGSRFTRKANLQRHINDKHNKSISCEKCFLCGQLFNDCDEMRQHIATNHNANHKFVLKKKAFGKALVNYRFTYGSNERELVSAQTKILTKIHDTIMYEASRLTVIKVSLILINEMIMKDHNGDVLTRATIPFRASNFMANAAMPRNIKSGIVSSFNQQRNRVEDFMNTGSNWVFNRAIAFDIEIGSLRPIRAGSKVDIANFKNKSHLFNPESNEGTCFLDCVVEFLYGDKIKKLEKKKRKLFVNCRIKEFNLKGIQFPISIDEIKKFLRRNPKLNLKINILLHQWDEINSKKELIFPFEFGLGDGKKIMNLLMTQIKKSETSCINHFLLIKDTDKYLRNVYKSEKTGKLSYQKSHFCLNCLNQFSSKNVLEKHQRICCMNKPRLETVEEVNKTIKFKNFHHQYLRETIAFLDFECILPKEKKNTCDVCTSLRCKCDKSYTDVISQQLPIGYSFVILQEDQIIHEKTYMGADAGIHFVRHLMDQEKKWLRDYLNFEAEMQMSDIQLEHFESQTKCYMCQRKFNDSSEKQRDHSHCMGTYLGAACLECNLKRRSPKKLKILIHNGSRFDYHFIVKALNAVKVTNINVLPYNGENFRTISFNCFEFNDSLAFLQASLAQLTDDLCSSGHDYNILKQTKLVKKNGELSSEKLDLLLRKTFFPYEYCTSLEKMRKTKKCPPLKAFYSSLSEKNISDDDYQFVKKTWKKFGCKNLIDYTEIYCKLDTILLAEVFQKFRKEMFAFSGLDPAFYISLPSYSFDSMLKFTKCKIDLLENIDMVHFIENGIRGGMAFINTRILEPTSAPDEESEIVYIDANVSNKLQNF